MRKKIKISILVAVLMFGLIGNSTVAFAGEIYKQITVSTNWTTIASNTEGFRSNVEITGMLINVGPRIDVRMLGKSGNVLWTENNSCPGLSSRVYNCGSDVYTIQVRVASGVQGTAIATKTSKPAN